MFFVFTLRESSEWKKKRKRSVRVKDVLWYNSESPPMRAHSSIVQAKAEKEELRKK